MTEELTTTSNYMYGIPISGCTSGLTTASFDNPFIPVTITTIEDFVKSIDDIVIENLIRSYENLLDNHFPKTPIKEQAYIIGYCIELIKNRYNTYDSIFKSWLVHIIRKLYELKVITMSGEIEQYMDKYVIFYNENYIQYIDDIEMYCSEYDRDIGFINRFIKIQKASNRVFST